MATDPASFETPGHWRVLDAEARQLASALRAGRLTVLVGAAAMGKTTLLAAGVLPLLRRRTGDLPQRTGATHVVAPFPDRRSRLRVGHAELLFHFDQWGDAPLSSFNRVLGESLGDPGFKAGDADSPEAMWPERLSTLSQRHGGARILFIFDHFEQLLEAPHERADAQSFLEAWLRAVNAPDLNAHFLVALDERAWPQLKELGQRIPGFDAQAFRLQVQSGRRTLVPLRGDGPAHRADAPGGEPAALDFEVSLGAMLSEVAKSVRRDEALSGDFAASLEAMLSQVAESARQAATSPSAQTAAPGLPGARDAREDACGAVRADTSAREANAASAAQEASRDAEAHMKAQAERAAEAELVARAHLAAEAEAAQKAEALRVAEAAAAAALEARRISEAAEAARSADAERAAQAERLARAQSDAESEAARKVQRQRTAEEAAAAKDRRIAQAAEAARKAEAKRAAEAELAAQARRSAEAQAARRAEARRVAEAAAAAQTHRIAEADDAARRADGERAAAVEREARDVPMPISAAAAGLSPPSVAASGRGAPAVAVARSGRPAHPALRWGAATLAVLVLGAMLWASRRGQPAAEPGVATSTTSTPAPPTQPVATVPPSPVGASPATATGAPGAGPATALSAPMTIPPPPPGTTESGRFEVQVDAVDGSGDRIAHELARALSGGGTALRVVPVAEGADPVVGLRAPGRLAIARYDTLRAARGNASAPPLRVLAPLYAEEVAFIVRADSPLRFIHELRGRRVNIGPDHEGGSRTVREIYRRMFGVAMTKPSQFGKDEALAELVAFRSIDAMAIVDAQPSAWLASLDPLTARGLRLLKLDPRHAADRRALRAFRTAVVQPGPGVRERTPTLAVMSFLVASGTGDADAKQLTDMALALCRELPRLRAGGHPKWRELQPSVKLDTGWPVVTSAQSALTSCSP